jgi:hypothetical protein
MDSATGAHHGVNEAASTVFLMKSGEKSERQGLILANGARVTHKRERERETKKKGE